MAKKLKDLEKMPMDNVTNSQKQSRIFVRSLSEELNKKSFSTQGVSQLGGAGKSGTGSLKGASVRAEPKKSSSTARTYDAASNG